MEISELQKLCKEVFEQREIELKAKETHSQEYAKLKALEAQLINILDAENLTNFSSEVGKYNVSEKASITTPQGEDRQVFFEYLKQKGDYEALITVNPQQLLSWFNKETEIAKQEKRIFYPPGLAMPTYRKVLRLTKNKA